MTNLLAKIENKTAKICVIGLGQVGLPTALTFCQSGFSVAGYDINKTLVSLLEKSKSPFEEKGIDELLSACMGSGKFYPSASEHAIRDSDVVIVCVTTPLTSGVLPDLSYLENACNAISSMSLENKLVIIESSIPPGTFKSLILPTLEKNAKLGKDFWIAFIPERLAPGTALSEIRTTPRIIGVADKDSGLYASSLYRNIVSAQIIVTHVEVAEVSKLVENAFRDVNVAFANEVGLICESYGIDVVDLIKVSNSHPRVKILQPGPGVGGPCLPKDPYLLLNPSGKSPIDSKLIINSRKINDWMPYHVVDLTINAIRDLGKTISDSTVLVLGVSYKANVSDVRFSPAEEIVSQLSKTCNMVLVYDPKSNETFGGMKVDDVWGAISKSDAIVIVTDHDEFKNLDLVKIQQSMKNPLIVDTRRMFSSSQAEDLGIKYVSVGYTKTLKDK